MKKDILQKNIQINCKYEEFSNVILSIFLTYLTFPGFFIGYAIITEISMLFTHL